MATDELALQLIRNALDVPAYKGRKVLYDGKRATIEGARLDGTLTLKFPDEHNKALGKFRFHPLAKLDYGDGIDHEARKPDEVLAWRKSQGLA